MLSFLKQCLVPLVLLASTLPAAVSAQAVNNCPEGKGCGWEYQAVEGTVCRLGARSGVAVRKAKNPSDTLVITMQGGGACTNLATCVAGAYSFDENDFAKATDPANSDAVTHLMSGIWNRQDANSQMASYNHIYIPYCSGDLHAGDSEAADFPIWPYKSQFRGWSNSKKYFEAIAGRIIKSIQDRQVGTPIRKVILSGFSAGAYGAVLNLPQLQRALAAAGRAVSVNLVNDSAPFFNNVDPTGANGGTKLWATCLQKALHDRFGYAKTFMAECSSCRPSAWMAAWQSAVLQANPKVNYAFLSSTDDPVIRAFLSSAAFAECEGQVPETHEAQYIEGLNEIRAALKSNVESGTRKTATYFESYNGWDELLGSLKHVFIHNGAPAAADDPKGSGYFFPYVGTNSARSWLEGFLSAPTTSSDSARHVGNCTPATLGTFNCN